MAEAPTHGLQWVLKCYGVAGAGADVLSDGLTLFKEEIISKRRVENVQYCRF